MKPERETSVLQLFRGNSCNGFLIVSCETWLLEKPPESDSARLEHIPSLPWESQLPLKPCISLQPLDFKGNCDSSDFLLDFCFVSRCSFNLLRKCGLLAHTSAAFLKNCCTEKLLFACGSFPAANSIIPFHHKKTAIETSSVSMTVFHRRFCSY